MKADYYTYIKVNVRELRAAKISYDYASWKKLQRARKFENKIKLWYNRREYM